MCLLQKWDAHRDCLLCIANTWRLQSAAYLDERVLRSFEKYLLEELGYGILPKTEVSLHNTFSPEKWYRFIPEHGFLLCSDVVSDSRFELNSTDDSAREKALVKHFSFSGTGVLPSALPTVRGRDVLQTKSASPELSPGLNHQKNAKSGSTSFTNIGGGRVGGDTRRISGNIFSGKNLIAIAREDWDDECLFDAKRLIRLVLTPLLGARNIHSRRLFMQFEDEKK